jgi:hypothetical protein
MEARAKLANASVAYMPLPRRSTVVSLALLDLPDDPLLLRLFDATHEMAAVIGTRPVAGIVIVIDHHAGRE